MTLESPTHGIARGFLAGGLVSLACTVVLPPVFQAVQPALSLPRAVTAVLWHLPILLGLGLGGAVAGRALGRGPRGVAAVAVAMFVASIIQELVTGDAGRLTGREDPLVVIALVLSIGAGAFAAGGVSAGVLLARRAGHMKRVVAGFACAGVLQGVCVVAAFFVARIGAGAVLGPAYPLALLVLQAASILVPFFFAGLVLAPVVEGQPG